MRALTNEERNLAEKNYDLIFHILKEANLSIEFYDVLLIPYLKATKEYSRLELEKNFAEYAREKMKEALAKSLREIGNRRQKKTICSLEMLKNVPSKEPDVCDFVIARMEGEGKRKKSLLYIVQ